MCRWPAGTRKDAQHCYLLEKCKTTMRYHIALVRMVIIKKSTNNKCWRGCGEKGSSPTLLVGMLNWCSHYGEQYGDFYKKLGIKLPYDQAIPEKSKSILTELGEFYF